MPLRDGETFAGYTILRRLGSGGMGEVYLVRHPRLPRHDALKILPPELTTDNDFRERFNREADLVAALWHPHIVGVHDRGEYDGQLWLSMDYVDGMDASRLLRDRYPTGMGEQDAIEIVRAIADALDYAHARNLLHRDVKPANILISFDQQQMSRVLLADFGIARKLDDTSGLTATNMTIGTVTYAAPEQLIGEPVDGRTDQYALAATAYHLLAGAPPFEHSNPAVVIGNHLNTAPAPLSRLRSELAHLDEPMQRALAKDPAHRFNTCTEFANALRRCSDRPHIVHTAVPETAAWHPPTPTPYPSAPTQYPSAPTQYPSGPTQYAASSFTPPPADANRARRQIWIIVAAFSAIAIVGAVAIAVVLTFAKEDSPQAGSATSSASRSPTAASSLPTTASRSVATPPPTAPSSPRPGYTIVDYIRDAGIVETPVKRGDPGSPTIDLPFPPGWEDAGDRTPDWAYGAIVSSDPALAADPPAIIALVSKLTGNVDPAKILEYAPAEITNLPGYTGAQTGSPGTLDGFDAIQIGGTYIKDGVRRAIAQKTVVIPSGDGVFVLQLNADGPEDQMTVLMDATSVIDEQTTITP
jgi:serine/threonine-protein kinase